MSKANPPSNGTTSEIVPQAYLDEHEAQNQLVGTIIKDIEELNIKKEALLADIANLERDRLSLQQEVQLQQKKKEARIDQHKQHHETLMKKLQEAHDSLLRTSSSMSPKK